MVDPEELYQAFNSIHDEGRQLYIDTFVLICHLHQQGTHIGSIKLLRDLLRKVNQLSPVDRSELFTAVINTLPGNEQIYALAVPMRAEFKSLFNSKNQAKSDKALGKA